MMIKFEGNISRLKSQLYRFYSINVDAVRSNSLNPEIHSGFPVEFEKVIDQKWEQKEIRRDDTKSLRIAILGLPNVGKSTLVNRLIGRPVCGMSSKVHTTRSNSDAIFVEDNTQLIFVDTPGLVTNRDFKKFKLSNSFKSDVDKSLKNADVVGVVQDAAHPFKSSIIDARIMDCLKKMNPDIRSILILNKIDKLKKKKRLLELVQILTSEENWPKFSDVFMVSGLKDDGVIDLRNYLLDTAEARDWEYDSNTVTNIKPEQMAADIVRSRFMDALPEEMPYLLQINVEHYGVLPDESVSIVVSVAGPTDRISKIVMGKHGARVKIVALQAEQELSQALRTTVRLKVAIKFSDKNEKLR